MDPCTTREAGKKGATFALAGLPNVGKSTLINRLMGRKCSIVSHHPHTTRRRVLGVCYHRDTQLVLCDTPGLATTLPNAMHRAMQSQLVATLQGADILVWMLRVDAALAPPKGLLQLLRPLELPLILVLNQSDRLAKGALLLPLLDRAHSAWQETNYLELIPISARRGTNIDRLKMALAKHASHNCWLYEHGFTNDQPELFYVAELIREKILWQTRSEVPHQLGVRIESMEKSVGLVNIHALIWVEKAGQKMIVIGQKGNALKRAGSLARTELERHFGCKVMLRLFVKVQQGWRNDHAYIAEHYSVS